MVVTMPMMSTLVTTLIPVTEEMASEGSSSTILALPTVWKMMHCRPATTRNARLKRRSKYS